MSQSDSKMNVLRRTQLLTSDYVIEPVALKQRVITIQPKLLRSRAAVVRRKTTP